MCSVRPVQANDKSLLALPLALLASTCLQALLTRYCQGDSYSLLPILPPSPSLTSLRHVLDELLLPAVCLSAVLIPVAMRRLAYPRRVKTRQWDAGGTARFCRALIQEDMDYVRKIVNIAPSLVNVNHPLGWAPLHVAALTGNVGMIRVLLHQRGVDVDVRDQSKFSLNALSGDIASRHAELSPRISGTSDTSGATPLHYACMAGDWDTIRALLNAGASPRTTDDRGRTPIQYFEEDASSESLKYFQHYLSAFDRRLRTIKKTVTVDLRTFCEAVCDNDFEFCEEALKSRSEWAFDKDTKGWTALHVAVVKNNPALVELILSYDKSTLNTPDTYHFCDCGLALCSPEHRKKFFQWGSLANSGGRYSTPLHYACMIGNWEIIELLLKSGADPKRKNQDGQLPEDLIDKTLDGAILQKYLALSNSNGLDCDSLPDLVSDDIDKDTLKDMPHGHSSDFMCPVDFNSPPYSEKVQSSDIMTKIADPVVGWNVWTPTSDTEFRNKYRKQKPMEDFLETKLIGQRGAILSVASAIRLRENGWSDPDRPLVFLFLGSSGVGKTELAKRIAQYVSYKPWLDGESVEEKTLSELERTNAFVRFDMSEYQQPHSVTNLIGSPKSYVGYDEGGSLTQKLKENPEAVVLLDEIEKAHEDLLTVFLQLFDDGRLTDSKYGTVYCPNAIFIMTSNLASDEIKAEAPLLRFGSSMSGRTNELDEYMQLVGKFTKKVHPVLKTALKRDEFLGRINQIVVLLPLKDNEIEIIIEQKLKEWRDRARDRHSIQLTWSPHVTKQLVKSHDVNFGVRSVLYEVEKMAVRLIAEAQIRGEIGYGWLAHLVVNRVRTIELRTLNPAASIREKNWCRYHS